MPARNRWMLLPLLASAAYAEETPREPDLRSRPEFRLHEAEVKPIDREKVPGQVREKGKVLQVDGETLLKNPELLSRAGLKQYCRYPRDFADLPTTGAAG